MSLDIILTDEEGREVYSTNITHNMVPMAKEAGIYDAIWRPEEICLQRASGVWAEIKEPYADLMTRPDHYAQFNPPNGWGDYSSFCEQVTEYLIACRRYPTAKIEACR